jgi:hypothetical protein
MTAFLPHIRTGPAVLISAILSRPSRKDKCVFPFFCLHCQVK